MTDFSVVLFLIVVAWGFFFLGMEYGKFSILNRLVDELEKESEPSRSDDLMAIKIEEHEGNVFAYREDDKLYLAHSDTAKDLMNQLREKFPGKNFAADEDSVGILIRRAKDEPV